MSIHRLSLSELATKLKDRELSAVEIVTALTERAEAIDPKIHALVHRFHLEALERARLADEALGRGESQGPLHGLPITIKESLSTRGVPVTLGVKSRRHARATEDAVTVHLLRRAGAIVIGKTNVSQTLLFHEADNPIWGPTNNPWNLARTPGGSSGGEAAAVAAGLSPAGIGTDIGGSIRVPAAFSGVAGFKPTFNRWSNIGSHSAMLGQEIVRSQCGPIARSVRDLSLLFRAIDSAQHAELDPGVPPISTPDPAAIDVSRLRIGVYDDDGFLRPAASVQRAVREAAAALQSAGATIVRFSPPKAVEIVYLYLAALSSDGGRTLERFLQGDEIAAQLKPLRAIAKMPGFVRRTIAAFVASQGEQRLERLLEVVHEKRVSDLWSIAAERTQLRVEVLAAWSEDRIDAVLCPAHATPALRHGQSRDFSLGASYSMRYNFLDFPAGVVPVTRVRAGETERKDPIDRLDRTAAVAEAESTGLPIGVQVVSRPHRDEVCLAVMAALEDALRGRPDFPTTPVDP